MAERARVVLNLVGPYAPVGREVVAACVEAGAYHVDISGEMQFIRRVITEFDDAARTAGVKVVQPAGFRVASTGLLLSQDAAAPPAGGCLPPSLALGAVNLGRFTPAGLTFQIA